MDDRCETCLRDTQTLDDLTARLVGRGAAWNRQQKRLGVLQEGFTAKYRISVGIGSLLLGCIVNESDQVVRVAQAFQRFDTIAIARKDK